MNKERAIKILQDLQKGTEVERDYLYDTNETDNAEFRTLTELIQALDIAIESLDNTMTNREYMHLVGVLAILDTNFDLDKPLEKDFVKFLYALNQVEKG